MNPFKRILFALFVLTVLALPAGSVAADTVYRLNLMAGVGGSLDDDDAGVSNSTFQLGFAVEPEDQLLVGLRVGRLDLGNGQVGSSFETTIDYATVVGEYRFTESFYESGLFIGLGLYSVDGTLLSGGSFKEESVGLVLGISGEFVITKKVGFVVELSGHYTNLETTDSLVMGHAGVAIHF